MFFPSVMALDFIAGCVGGRKYWEIYSLPTSHHIIIIVLKGGAGVLAGYPLDTVKVKIQTQDVSNAGLKYKGTFDCLFKLVKKDGVSGRLEVSAGVSTFYYLKARSLYKGMSSPLLGVAGINAITFGAYGNVLRLLPDQDSISSITLAGASAGLIQVTTGGAAVGLAWMRALTDSEDCV